jgi:hypothetical protein
MFDILASVKLNQIVRASGHMATQARIIIMGAKKIHALFTRCCVSALCWGCV